MKLARNIAAALCIVLLFAAPLYARFDDEDACIEEITSPQPLPVGTMFYQKETPKAGYQVYYTYMGFDGTHLRIRYDTYYHYDELEESETLTVPVTADGNALFITKPLYKETATSATKLVITIVDDLGRILVKKAK